VRRKRFSRRLGEPHARRQIAERRCGIEQAVDAEQRLAAANLRELALLAHGSRDTNARALVCQPTSRRAGSTICAAPAPITRNA